VIGVATIDSEKEAELKKLGAKDSKLISPVGRERLYPIMKETCVETHTIKITAEELNVLMDKFSLNEIEAMKAAELLKLLKKKPAKLFVDSPDGVAKRFEERIRAYLPKESNLKLEICSEHKADYNYPVVSAASIVAKVDRDAEIEKIKKIVGEDFGSGYSSDPRTIDFLKRNLARPEVRKFVRMKWETVAKLGQTKLFE